MLLYVTLGTNDVARAGRFYDPVWHLSVDRAFRDENERMATARRATAGRVSG